MSETDIKEEKSKIAKLWLPRTYYAMNVWFPPYKSNPEELRNKVMWYSAPKTVYDIMENCIYRDDAGDKDDPQAYGLFFDPEKCFVFKLDIYKKGEFNSYEKSKFLPAEKTLLELAKSEDKVKELLEARLDISSKFDERDGSAIKLAVTAMIEGGDPEPEAKPKPKAKPKESEDDELLDEDATASEDVKVSSGDELLDDTPAASSGSEEADDDEDIEADPELAGLLSDLHSAEED